MVPTTRSMSVINKEIIDHFDKLIEPLVTISSLKELLKELKDGIISSLELKIQQQDEKIRSLEDKIATQSGSFELRLKEQNDKIRSLEGKIVTQGVVIDQLQIAADNNESYSRRSCLRINNIPCDNNEDDIVLNKKIENCYKEMNVVYDASQIDRVHRIGRKYRKNGVNYQQIIIKFKSWKARELFYRSRPRRNADGKKKPGASTFSVNIDLTKRRYELFKHAINSIKGNKEINYVFADINCSLGMKMSNGSFKYFNTKSEFEHLNLLLDE